jgi:hypothetical protein
MPGRQLQTTRMVRAGLEEGWRYFVAPFAYVI